MKINLQCWYWATHLSFNSNPEERVTEFVKILSTAYNELSSFNNCLPYFTELSNEFVFLNKFIPNICPEIGESGL